MKRTFKRTSLAITLVLLLILSLGGCGQKSPDTSSTGPQSSGETSTPTTSDTSDLPVVGLSHFNVGANNYTSIYTSTINELMGSDYKGQVELVLLDAQGDAEKQLSDIDDLISMKCDAVILWPVSASAVIPGVQKLHDAGIPIINTNSGIDKSGQDMLTAFSGPSDYNQGYQAGEAMVAGLGGEGKVVELSGLAGYDTSILRSQGFADAIKGSNIELLESQPADWSTEKAQTLMETYIAKYGDKINGVYCADDGIAEGAMNALESVGRNDGSVVITSPTLFASGYDAIAEGKQYASVLQSPIEDAKLALQLAVTCATGGTVEYDNRIQTFIVNQDNYTEFDRPTW